MTFTMADCAKYDKGGLLHDYLIRYGAKTLIETGLYRGFGSGMRFADAVRYIALDSQAENVEAATLAGYEARLGDSADSLRVLLAEGDVEPPAVFWLDAHALEGEGSPNMCPVLDELAAIAAWEHAVASVVLINDLWGMGALPGWPALGLLRERADSYGLWERDEAEGVMRLIPAPLA